MERGRRLPNRLAFFLVGVFLLGIVALLPFALAGVVEDIVGENGPNYVLARAQNSSGDAHAQLNIMLRNVDEWQHTASMTISGLRSCAVACTTTDRVHFVSIPLQADKGQGLPPYATIMFPPNQKGVSQDATLPVSGSAIRYPFDRYRLEVGVVVQRVSADGTVQTLSPSAAASYLSLSVNGSVPKMVVDQPSSVDPSGVPADDPAYEYASVSLLTFSRPLYVQVTSVVLVLLISAAAAYAIFMRPLAELVINAGALVFGVWGVRAILLGYSVPGFTAVDLSLMSVVLFLLTALTWRALWFLRAPASVPP